MSAASDGRHDGAATPDVMGELNTVRARVREQLGELIDALDDDGGAYADRLAEHALWAPGRNGLGSPPAPASLAGEPAKLIRGLVLDEVTAARIYGARRRSAAAA